MKTDKLGAVWLAVGLVGLRDGWAAIGVAFFAMATTGILMGSF